MADKRGNKNSHDTVSPSARARDDLRTAGLAMTRCRRLAVSISFQCGVTPNRENSTDRMRMAGELNVRLSAAGPTFA